MSRYNQQAYTQYDLSAYSAWFQGLAIDFVPFSEYDAVLFFSQSNSKLIRLDLVTGSVTEFTQTGNADRLIACNNWGTYRGGYRLISRLGTGSKFIFCSLNEARTNVLINIGDIVTQTTLHSYNFNFAWTGPGTLPWNILIGGDDGSIYIHVLSADPRLIWQEIAGAPLPQLSFWGWRLFRFEPLLGAWSVRNISPEEMGSDNFPLEDVIVDISRLAAVMQNGDVIYHHQWQDINSPTPLNEKLEISRYNANFELLARTEIEEIEDSQLNFVGISGDANFLLLDPSELDESIEIRLNISPNATADDDQIVHDINGDGLESATLHGERSSDADGTIASYVWTEVVGGNITQIATGVTPSVNLAVGTHTITLTVTDSDGATDTDEVVAKVNAPPVATAGSESDRTR
ncbi:MAG: hypothetical protein IPK52_02895 [Chloroflexi bacterium]|nr:hypothetical protein [Chloroflexota bacterium]